jgi:hypothetical protein
MHSNQLLDHLIRIAATLAGDGQGSELGDNPEYERGMAELIARATGQPAENVPLVLSTIHGEARLRRL